MDDSRYLTVVYDPTWEEDAKKITPSPQDMEDHLRAAEFMAQRVLAKEIDIPQIPGTDVYVFRLEGRIVKSFPATRWFFLLMAPWGRSESRACLHKRAHPGPTRHNVGPA